MGFDQDFLIGEGFLGFRTIRELCSKGFQEIPELPGVYAVSHHPAIAPVFLVINTGYRFKGRDPSVSINRLISKWIDGAEVYYLGRARGLSKASTLKKRVKSLVKFGQRMRAAHWGGRYIWQLSNSNDLKISWKECSCEDAIENEKHYLDLFETSYGRLPFANLRH
jgi:hypothetical protein